MTLIRRSSSGSACAAHRAGKHRRSSSATTRATPTGSSGSRTGCPRPSGRAEARERADMPAGLRPPATKPTTSNPQRKEIIVGSPSESFTKLKEQMDRAAQTVVSAASGDEAAVRAKIDDARTAADAQTAELHGKTQEASDAAADHWHQIRSDWQQHVERSRKRL